MGPKNKIKLTVDNQKTLSEFWRKGSDLSSGEPHQEECANLHLPESEPSETSKPELESPHVSVSDIKTAETLLSSGESFTVGSQEKSKNDVDKAQAIELFKEYFEDALRDGKLHSFYTCSGKCSELSGHETNRIRSQKTLKADASKKRTIDTFRHSWLTERKTSYCEKTGIWWMIYVEGSGMFCLLCRVHNTSNKFNKQNTFNVSPSVNFKHSAITEHQRSTGHVGTHLCELERRNSSLVAMHKEAVMTRDTVTFNAFLASYWLAKEEVANRKMLSLIALQKQSGVEEMINFQNTSERSQKDMRLLLGQLIKSKLIQNIQDAKWFSVLVDEVTDCSTTEQLLIYVGYVDVNGDSHFDFLDCKDVLEDSRSPDAATITRCITDELKSCKITTKHLCGFGSDGASVMTGANNGVGTRLQAVANTMLRTHCISHRLALACGDSNDDVKYIPIVETVLRQLWKWLEYPKRCSAFVKVCKSLHKIDLASNPDKQNKVRKKLAVKIQKACRTRWLSTGQSIASVCKNFVALMMTLRDFKEADATAHGLLTRMNNAKFVGAILLLNRVLPHLNALSKLFQKEHTCYTSIKPALQATKSALADIRKSFDIVHELKLVIQPGGVYGELELHLSDKDPVRHFLESLVTNYTTALERNLDRRFEEASPVLQAFSVFDPSSLPAKTDETFADYGKQEIQTLSNQFHFDPEETVAEWQNFKFQITEWKIPPSVLRGDDISPTHYVLKKLVKEQVAYRIGFNNLVELAQICLTQPLSNAVVERGASAVKRVKTRLRSTLKNNMLASLLHISLNGPSQKSEEGNALLMEASTIWRTTQTRNLPAPVRLPAVGGSDHMSSLYHPATTAECGVQTDTDLTEMPATDEQEALDEHVQVQTSTVCGEEAVYSSALQALDMADSDSGLESDFEDDL